MCNAGELADALDAALRGRPTRLVFDLSETTFIDGAAISRIVRAGSTAAGDCPVVIRNPRPVVVKALAALGLDGFCRVEHDPGGQPPPPGP